MTGTEIAALITAVTAAIAAVFAAVRNLLGDSTKREVDQAARLLAGYVGMVERLQAQLDTIGDRHDRELRALEERHSRDRAEWQAERERCTERIDELGAMVYALQNRPPESRDRIGDP